VHFSWPAVGCDAAVRRNFAASAYRRAPPGAGTFRRTQSERDTGRR
jgi:hypothetical protein